MNNEDAKNLKDELKRLLRGESVDDVVNSLFEAEASEIRGPLGVFKAKLREMAKLGANGFDKTISGYQSPPRLKYANECDEILKDLTKSFLAPPPVRAGELITSMAKAGDNRQLTQLLDRDTKTLAMKANRAGCNDAVLTAAIHLSDAGEKLYLALTSDD